MTEEEIKALLDTLIENFRAFVAEEVQKYYDTGTLISSQEIAAMLRAYEANEMTKLFNSEAIPQDKFRIFIRHYLRLWLDMLVAKINETNENLTDVAGKVIEVDSVDELPLKEDDDSYTALVGIVKGSAANIGAGAMAETYYFDSVHNEWIPVGVRIPVFADVEELPDTGDSGNISIAGGDLYFWDGDSWTKLVTEDDLDDAIETINRSIEEIRDLIGQNLLDDNDRVKTYHDAVLEIVTAVPAMTEGDRYLLTAGEGETVEGWKTIQEGVTTTEAENLGRIFVFDDNSVLWGAENSSKDSGLIYSKNNTAHTVAGFLGQIANKIEMLGNSVYFIERVTRKIYVFDKTGISVQSVKLNGVDVTAANGFHVFENRLFFNYGGKFSYIDVAGNVTVGAEDSSPADAVSAVYNGKLHILGGNGLYIVQPGATTPEHVAGTIFDASPVASYHSAYVFNNILYVGGDTNAATRHNAIIAWNGTAGTPCIDETSVSYNRIKIELIQESGGDLYAASEGGLSGESSIWKLTGGTFAAVASTPINDMSAIWNGTYYFINGGRLRSISLDTLQMVSAPGNLFGVTRQGDRLFIVELQSIPFKGKTGQYWIKEYVVETVNVGGEIKIVGMDGNGQYDELFVEGHRVVVKTSPTGFSREYGIRNGELIDADGSDNNAIIGNVDTHADLLAVVTTNIKVGDGYVVEHDENHDGNSAIYTWDGTVWNFTHLWEISLNLKYGQYTVDTTPFTFAKFAAKNENSEEFDVLEVSFDSVNAAYDVAVTGASGNTGDTRIMIFNVAANQTVTLTFGFPHKLVEGGELTLAEGFYAVTVLRGSTNLINIAPYE
jgi:hypothetical protein